MHFLALSSYLISTLCSYNSTVSGMPCLFQRDFSQCIYLLFSLFLISVYFLEGYLFCLQFEDIVYYGKQGMKGTEEAGHISSVRPSFL